MATQPSTTLAGQLAADLPKGKSLWGLAWERFRRKKLAMISLVIISAFYLSGIFAGVLAPYSFRTQNLDNSEQLAWAMGPYCALAIAVNPGYKPVSGVKPPGTEHLLGTDRLGRDLLTRILYGIRTSVVVSLASILTGTLILGVVLGMMAAYLRGWVDAVIMRVGEVFLSFPGLLLVILISATIRARVKEWFVAWERANGVEIFTETGMVDYFVVFGAMALFGWVGVARIIRGQILQMREMEYITAARAIGASTPTIMRRHILPNLTNILIYMISAGLGGAVGSELVLSFIGVGVQPPVPSLGVMIYEQTQGQTNFIEQIGCMRPPMLLAPLMLATVVFFSFALLGDGLIDALNPRSSDKAAGFRQGLS